MAGVSVMSPRASASLIAFMLLPRKPLVRIASPLAETGDGIGFMVRPALCQTTSPVARS